MTGVPALRDVLRRYTTIPIIVEMKVDSARMGQAVAEELRAQAPSDGSAWPGSVGEACAP